MTAASTFPRRAAARPTPRSRNGTGSLGGRARAAASSWRRAPLHIFPPRDSFDRWQTGRTAPSAPHPGAFVACPRLLISKRLGAAAPSPAAAPILANPFPASGHRDHGRSPRAAAPSLSWVRGVSCRARAFAFGVPRAPGAGRMHRSAPKIRAIASAVMRTATATGRGSIPQVLARPVAPLSTVAA